MSASLAGVCNWHKALASQFLCFYLYPLRGHSTFRITEGEVYLWGSRKSFLKKERSMFLMGRAPYSKMDLLGPKPEQTPIRTD
jgi:hypothetical protein